MSECAGDRDIWARINPAPFPLPSLPPGQNLTRCCYDPYLSPSLCSSPETPLRGQQLLFCPNCYYRWINVTPARGYIWPAARCRCGIYCQRMWKWPPLKIVPRTGEKTLRGTGVRWRINIVAIYIIHTWSPSLEINLKILFVWVSTIYWKCTYSCMI